MSESSSFARLRTLSAELRATAKHSHLNGNPKLVKVEHLFRHADALDVEIAQVEKAQQELTLIREAAQDPALSDGAARAVACGLQPPTQKDIEWATKIGEWAQQEQKDE